jgi:hypothetical protein
MSELIRVYHYDYKYGYFLDNIEMLRAAFAKHPHVDYQVFEPPISPSYKMDAEEVEAALANKDIFLVHPGVECQSIVNGYPEKFPNLRILLLVPGIDNYKEVHEKIKELGAFSYDYIEQIVEWVLSPT